jgi:hypothetical protein
LLHRSTTIRGSLRGKKGGGVQEEEERKEKKRKRDCTQCTGSRKVENQGWSKEFLPFQVV